MQSVLAMVTSRRSIRRPRSHDNSSTHPCPLRSGVNIAGVAGPRSLRQFQQHNASEDNARPNLTGTRIQTHGVVLTERRRRDIRRRHALERMKVEYVVKLATQLDVHFFRDMEVLVKVHVEICLTIQAQNIASKRSKVAKQRLGKAEAGRVVADGNSVYHCGSAGRTSRPCRLRVKVGDRPGDIGTVHGVAGSEVDDWIGQTADSGSGKNVDRKPRVIAADACK